MSREAAPPAVFVVLRGITDLGHLRVEMRRADRYGAAGIFLSDHIAPSLTGVDPLDPYTMLGAAGALDDRLAIGTFVANVGVLHPVLAARHFLQLALLYGGERVVAGIGAGWHVDDFRMIGMVMPRHPDRVDRLEEAARVMRRLFDTGTATFAGRHVVVGDLAIPRMPDQPPQLLIGGGSSRLLDIAARFADRVDLNAPNVSTQFDGRDPQRADRVRRLTTTVAELEAGAKTVVEMAAAVGRDPSKIRLSVFLSQVVFCADGKVEEVERAICERAGLPWRPLHECPYVLVGERDVLRRRLDDRIAQLSLSALVTTNGPHLEDFMSHVVAGA